MSEQLGGEDYLELRGRYLRLLSELRRTHSHNPETLKALEEILGREEAKLNPDVAGQESGFPTAPFLRVVRKEPDCDTGRQVA